MTTAWRMRYAGHLGLRGPDVPLFAHGARSRAPLDQIRYLADLGFAGVQDNFLELRPAEEQARIGTEIARRGLEMGSFTGNPANWNRPTWNLEGPAARDTLAHTLEASIESARRVNGRCVACVTGLRSDVARERQIAAMIENLQALAERGERAGIILCVEPVATQWIPGLLVQSVGEAAHIVAAVGSPAVRLTFDVAHVEMSDGNVLRHLEQFWPLIGAIQIADLPGRVELGAGRLDWPALLGAMRRRGWQGLLELEHMPAEESLAGEHRLVERLRALDALLD
jgi:hydroxypyruvate isomerase